MVDILFVTPDLHRGGVGRCVYFMIEELPKHGLSTSLFCVREIEHEFTPSRANVSRGIASKISNRGMQLLMPWAWIKLLMTIRREKPAIVCSHGLLCNLMVAIARGVMPGSFRSVAFEHNSPSSHYRSTSMGALKRWLLRLCYNGHDTVVGVSKGVVDDLVAMLPSLQGKCRTIYNGIPLEDVRTQARAAASKLPDDGKLHVVGLGRLVKTKGVQTLIEAAAILDDPAISITLVGEGPDRAEFEQMIAQMKPGTPVHLLGHVDNPFPTLADADIFVTASERESFGIVLVEALCLGVPVISSDCPSGPAEILEDGKFGELVPVGDAAAVARTIRSLSQDRSRREHLAQLGPQRAADFALERHCRHVVEMFDPLLEKKSLERVGART